ncbi:MAG: tRNA pseudouridine(38-40) synthase TruA, partial [Actinomycetota bacterium]
MPVVRLTLAYDGTGFRGWARQKGQRPVAGGLEDALSRFLGSMPQLSVAGRTDAGVHARGQVASFAWNDALDLARLHASVNSMLAPEVVVLEARPASAGFDARFSATAREYRYRIDAGPWPDPFDARFVWHRPGQVSLPAMRSAARHLVGEHDFSAFCRNAPGGSGNVRRLERLSVSRTGDRIEVTARANAFAHQMVRSLVGTLVAIGEGSRDADQMPAVLASRDRSRAAQIAPSHGL